MTKKILLIIGILAVMGLAIFLIFFSKPQSDTGGERLGFSIRDFLPFGKSPGVGTDTEITETKPEEEDSEVIDQNKPIPRLRRISGEPVAGAVIFNIGTTSIVRFIEKGTGNVYEASSNSLNIQRLTNTTIPKIIRAFWLPNGSGFLGQTLTLENEVAQTSFVKLNKNVASSTNETLTPFGTTIGKLPTDIKEISIKPDGTKIFYYTIKGSYSEWVISNPDGTNSSVVFSHPLTEWQPKWISANLITMQNKGGFGVTGYNYLFDVTGKTLKKNGVGATGISSNTNSDGSLSLVSSGGTSPLLYLVNNNNVSSDLIGAKTLAEKCVWLDQPVGGKIPTTYCAVPNYLPNGIYPDSWYKGLISTSDTIYKIELVDNIPNKISDLSLESGEQIDVVDMNISPDKKYLIFRNKIDGYLWMLRIEE